LESTHHLGAHFASFTSLLIAAIPIGFTLVTVFIPVVVIVGFGCEADAATGTATDAGFVIVKTKESGDSSRFN
jgi:hypothetical protein